MIEGSPDPGWSHGLDTGQHYANYHGWFRGRQSAEAQMFDWFGIGKAVASPVKDQVEKYRQHRRESRWDFVMEALGPEPLSCLEWPAHSDNGVSLSTVERRLALLQEKHPERARKCGIPAIHDPNREQWIRNVLQEMVRVDLVRRCRTEDRWELA